MEASDTASDTNNNNNNHIPGPPLPPLLQQYPLLKLPVSTPHYLLSDQPFVPDPALMENLTSKQGFSELKAKKALYWTGNEDLSSALEWLGEKNQSVEESPLEDDILQMKSELERKHQELKEREESSEDPSTVEYVDDLFPCNTEDEEFELAVILNQSLRMNLATRMKFTEEAAKDLTYNLSLTPAGDSQVRSWEKKSDKAVTVGWAESSHHLSDLQLCATSLELETMVNGMLWDRERLQYNEIITLAIWGPPQEVQKVVGRLIVPTSEFFSE